MADTEQAQEEVGTLDGPEPEELGSLLDLDKARTVHLRGVTLGLLDGSLYSGKRVLWVENPLLLLDTNDKPVGFATVFTEGQKVKADAHFDFATPDRLTLETQSFAVWAYPLAYTTDELVYIFGVKLDLQRPTDPRHEPITVTVYSNE